MDTKFRLPEAYSHSFISEKMTLVGVRGHESARQMFRFQAAHSLREGIVKTIAKFMDHREIALP